MAEFIKHGSSVLIFLHAKPFHKEFNLDLDPFEMAGHKNSSKLHKILRLI